MRDLLKLGIDGNLSVNSPQFYICDLILSMSVSKYSLETIFYNSDYSGIHEATIALNTALPEPSPHSNEQRSSHKIDCMRCPRVLT